MQQHPEADKMIKGDKDKGVIKNNVGNNINKLSNNKGGNQENSTKLFNNKDIDNDISGPKINENNKNVEYHKNIEQRNTYENKNIDNEKENC